MITNVESPALAQNHETWASHITPDMIERIRNRLAQDARARDSSLWRFGPWISGAVVLWGYLS